MENAISSKMLEMLQELEQTQKRNKTKATHNYTLRLTENMVEQLEAVCEKYKVRRADVVRNCLETLLTNLYPN